MEMEILCRGVFREKISVISYPWIGFFEEIPEKIKNVKKVMYDNLSLISLHYNLSLIKLILKS